MRMTSCTILQLRSLLGELDALGPRGHDFERERFNREITWNPNTAHDEAEEAAEHYKRIKKFLVQSRKRMYGPLHHVEINTVARTRRLNSRC